MPNKHKKILLFCVPFSGHLNVLKEFISHYQNKFELRLVITGWKNIPPDLSGVSCTINRVEVSYLHETDPALWTFPRVAEEMDACIKITKEFNPDLIIYDFFSIEGNLIGKLLNIPYYCSIPAMIGPFDNKKYLQQKLSKRDNQKAIKIIEKKYSLKLKDIEMISDGLHLSGEINLVWSYRQLVPLNFMRNRLKAKYVFVGRLEESQKSPQTPFKKKHSSKPLIYFSLGTVVMNNLWNQQINTRKALKKIISNLTKLWGNKYKVIFVSQGKKILKNYPEAWEVLTHAPQEEILRKASVFITHGGNNSFNEAVKYKVPMVVIPFFGDQLLVGKQVQKLGLGINLGLGNNIDTKKPKNFLNEELVARIDKAVKKVLREEYSYRKKYSKLKLRKTNLGKSLFTSLPPHTL